MNQTFKTYLFSYEHDGASWVLEVKASDPIDAQRRLKRIQYANYDGELVAKIAMPSFANVFSSKIKELWAQVSPSRQN
jgi:hypothetical protein